jgi:iron complex outermembrane recepter protein
MTYRKLCLWGASSLAIAAWGAPALAADAPVATAAAAGTIEELVVTAQKRAENIQDVPLSITAVSAKAMEAKGIENAQDLVRAVPNLRLDSVGQQSSVALRIRGFGASSSAAIDPSVAPYIDGVFIPRPGAILASFLDVDSVEVLRGPQGTLFGRNATVGAISIRTHAPDLNSFAGSIAGELGNYGERKIEGMVNLPVNDRFGLRIAGLATSTDGFAKNVLDGRTYGQHDTVEGRISGKWLVTDHLTWTLRADYAKTSGDGNALNQVDTSTASATQLANFAARTGTNPASLTYPPSLNADQRYDNQNLNDKQYGVASDLSWEVGDGHTLRLIDSWRSWKDEQSDGDVVFSPLDLLTRDARFDSDSNSHELQFISKKGAFLDGKLDFVAGLYDFEETYQIGEVLNLGSQYCSFAVAAAAPPLVGACNASPKNGAATGAFDQKATSIAAYVQGNYALTPTVDLTLGARETQDKKTGSFVETLANPTAALLRVPENTQLSFKDTQPTWRGNVSWHISPDVMAFVTYSTGYKSGGFNSAGGAQALGQKRIFNSETSQDWEAGVKSVLFDRRLLVNVTAYRTDLDDFQDRSFDGVSFIIRNAGNVRAQGVELEAQAKPTNHINIDLGLAYLDSTFTANHNAPGLPACTGAATSCPLTQDLTGRTPNFSPRWNNTVGLEYVTDPLFAGFTASLRADATYNSSYSTTNDLNPQSIVQGVTIYGARMTLTSPDHSWNVALFGQNLTDEHVFTTKFAQTLDSLFGVRVPATGATLLRGFMNTPRTYGVRIAKTF